MLKTLSNAAIPKIKSFYPKNCKHKLNSRKQSKIKLYVIDIN